MPVPMRQAQGVGALLNVLAREYKTADPTHAPAAAARARTMASALQHQLASWNAIAPSAPLAQALGRAQEVSRSLNPTSERFQPWPLPLSINAELAQLKHDLRTAGLAAAPPPRSYDAIEAGLAEARGALATGDRTSAVTSAAESYALLAEGPGKRLAGANVGLAGLFAADFWGAGGVITSILEGTPGQTRQAIQRAEEELGSIATVLGDRTIGKGTVVADAAVIVFREGLEAVLILAAITASFVGERRRLRRPVLIGAVLGLGATAVTYLIAQALIDALGDGGLRLQAITGLLAIAVLLLVTNWFFHRVYWSEWLGRFHRRRRAIERLDRFGFLSGQLMAFTLLGLTSVYREGFETVLFLQNLQVSAGSQVTMLGIGIGLAGTLAVGFVTFKLERKLPYKKMLVATGVLIGLVLAVMVGTTVHTMQGLGWLPSTPAGVQLQLWWGQWLGVYATLEGIGAQLLALLAVYGSYVVARGLQLRRRTRAVAQHA